MNPAKTPLRYRRINRRNGSIQKISSDSYASRKGIPSNTPLNVSPQRTFKNDFSPIQLQNFKEELGIRANDSAKKRRKPKRPLNIEDILGDKKYDYNDEYDNHEQKRPSPVRSKKDKYRSDKSAGYRRRGIPQDSKVKRNKKRQPSRDFDLDRSKSRDNSKDKMSRSRMGNKGSRYLENPERNKDHEFYADNST